MRRKIRSLYVVPFLLFALVLNACVAAAPSAPAESAAPAAPAAEPPSEPQSGGTLNVWQPNGWPEQSWPHRSNWESSWAISPMSETLFWPMADGTMEPILGESLDISDDGLVYTLHLREGVTWHDGEPFTAADVLYTYEIRFHPELRPLNEVRQGRTIKGLMAYHDGTAETIEGITIIDDLTLQVTLDSPDAGLARLFFGDLLEIIPKHIIETLDPEQVYSGTAEYWYTAPVGTGPYKFVQYETDQFIEYERNENYWGGAVGPERLFLKIATPEVAVVQLQRGEIDFVNPLQLTEVSRLEGEATIDVIVAENNAQWYGLEMNYFAENGLWSNPKAKQAFLYSIDRQAYVDSILQGLGTVRHSFYDGTPYACPTMTEYNYDPEKAKALWAEIGVDPSTITIDMMAWTGIKARLDYLPIAQEYLRAQGFTVNVDIIDPTLIPEYTQGSGTYGKEWDFHVLLFGPGADPGSILPFISEDSTSNVSYRSWPEKPDATTGLKPTAEYYTNPALPDLIAQAEIETDPQKRIEIYQQIDCIWNEELPAFMTASPPFVVAKSQRLQGVDWQSNAGLGFWTKMYKPGSWWLWDMQ